MLFKFSPISFDLIIFLSKLLVFWGKLEESFVGLGLQVDYNLYGMSHIHVSNVKFRPPLPDSFKSQISCCTAQSIELEEKPTSVSSSLQVGYL